MGAGTAASRSHSVALGSPVTVRSEINISGLGTEMLCLRALHETRTGSENVDVRDCCPTGPDQLAVQCSVVVVAGGRPGQGVSLGTTWRGGGRVVAPGWRGGEENHWPCHLSISPLVM